MRETVPEGGVLSGGQGQEIFEGLLDEHMSEVAALRSEGGMGEALYRYFSGHVAAGPPAPDAPVEPPRPDGD